MAARRLVGPALEPITLVEAKAHLRLRTADQDARVEAAIRAARAAIEVYTERALLPQTWAQVIDTPCWAWPGPGWSQRPWIELAAPPLLAIASVAARAPGVADLVLDPAWYAADVLHEPGRIVWAVAALNAGLAAFTARPATLVVTYTAGYAEVAALPPTLVQATYQLMATFFLHREEGIVLPVSQAMALTPFPVREYLDPFRLGSLA